MPTADLDIYMSSVLAEESPPRENKKSTLNIQLARLGVLIVFLGLWQVIAQFGWIDKLFISEPTDVAKLWWKLAITTGTLWANVWATAEATIAGLIVGSALGILAGAVLGYMVIIDRILDPYLSFINGLPRIALAPLFILWFGIGLNGKIILAISLVFFIMLINTRSAVRQTDPDLLAIGNLLGGNRVQMFIKIIAPSAVPGIFAGLRLAAIYSLLGVIVGEFIAAQKGLGQQVTYYSGTFNTAGVMALLFTIGMFALLMNLVIGAVEQYLLRWKKGDAS